MNGNVLLLVLPLMSLLTVSPALIWPCPRTCTAKDQILSCTHLRETDLLALVSCIEDLPKTVVVELNHSGLPCTCVFVDFVAGLRHVNIVIFHDISCPGNIVTICHSYNSPSMSTRKLSGHWAGKYVPLFGDVFNVKMFDWRLKFDSYYRKLWADLAKIENLSVRHAYLALLMKKSREAERELSKPARFGGEDRTQTGNAPVSLQVHISNKTHVFPYRKARMTKVIIFCSIVGVVVFVILVMLICKLECERRKMMSTRNNGDLCLDARLQTRLNNWRSFLEKLACYKKHKAELAAVGKNSFPPSTKDMYVKQGAIKSNGDIDLQDAGQTVAVSSLSKLVPLQPEKSDRQLCDPSTIFCRNRSRTNIVTTPFEPLRVSSSAESLDHGGGNEVGQQRGSFNFTEDQRLSPITRRMLTTGDGNSDDRMPLIVDKD